MSEKRFKASIYKKIMVKSSGYCVKINCIDRPKFLYEIKDAKVLTSSGVYNIGNDFIYVDTMEHNNNEGKLIRIESGDRNSYFTLAPDFSNILEITGKFSTLIELMSRSFEWKHLILEPTCALNYIKCYERDLSKLVDVYVNKNFKDFDNLENYDFILTEKTNSDSSGQIIFDGEILETNNYIVKFIRRPTFDKFTVNLDSKINNVTFGVPYGYYYTPDIISRYILDNRKYDIHFKIIKMEHFLYLKLLNDVSWLDDCDEGYTENDILMKVYGF